jgi:hypothetical protein
MPPQPAPPADSLPNLAGDYRITFVAQTCQLMFPTEFRTRTYASRLEQKGADVTIVLNGLPPKFSSEHPKLWGHIRPDPVKLTLTNFWGNDQWDLLEQQVTPTNTVRLLVNAMELTVSTDPGILRR